MRYIFFAVCLITGLCGLTAMLIPKDDLATALTAGISSAAFFALIYLVALIGALWAYRRARKRLALSLLGVTVLYATAWPLYDGWQAKRSLEFATAHSVIPENLDLEGRDLLVLVQRWSGCSSVCRSVVNHSTPATVHSAAGRTDAPLPDFSDTVNLMGIPHTFEHRRDADAYNGVRATAASPNRTAPDTLILDGEVGRFRDLARILVKDGKVPSAVKVEFAVLPVENATALNLADADPTLLILGGQTMHYRVPFHPLHKKRLANGYTRRMDILADLICPEGKTQQVTRNCTKRK